MGKRSIVDGGKKETGYSCGVESSQTRILKGQRNYRNGGTLI